MRQRGKRARMASMNRAWAGQPEVNHLTNLSIWKRFFLTTGRAIFGSETHQETIVLGTGFRTSSKNALIRTKKLLDRNQNALNRAKYAPIRPKTPRLDARLTSCTLGARLCQRHCTASLYSIRPTIIEDLFKDIC